MNLSKKEIELIGQSKDSSTVYLILGIDMVIALILIGALTFLGWKDGQWGLYALLAGIFVANSARQKYCDAKTIILCRKTLTKLYSRVQELE